MRSETSGITSARNAVNAVCIASAYGPAGWIASREFTPSQTTTAIQITVLRRRSVRSSRFIVARRSSGRGGAGGKIPRRLAERGDLLALGPVRLEHHIDVPDAQRCVRAKLLESDLGRPEDEAGTRREEPGTVGLRACGELVDEGIRPLLRGPHARDEERAAEERFGVTVHRAAGLIQVPQPVGKLGQRGGAHGDVESV